MGFVGDAHKNNDARAQISKRMPYKLRGHKLTVYVDCYTIQFCLGLDGEKN